MSCDYGWILFKEKYDTSILKVILIQREYSIPTLVMGQLYVALNQRLALIEYI